jgi:hypothetical protein
VLQLARLPRYATEAHFAIADGLFWARLVTRLSQAIPKVGQTIPIVAETDQIANRGIFRLKSRAQISDGSGRRFFVAGMKSLRREIKALRYSRTIEWE